MTMQEVQKRCVDDFPLSQTRREIMSGLSVVVQRLIAAGIAGHMWVDGSFLTEKIDPEDVDLLLRISSNLYDNATLEQRETIHWFVDENGNLKTLYRCDCYVWLEFPHGHPAYNTSEEQREYWTRQYGQSRRNVNKGIAVVELPGGAV